MINNMMDYLHSISNFIDEIMNISISQWDVENKSNEETIEKLQR
jgi:hypothetical protein